MHQQGKQQNRNNRLIKIGRNLINGLRYRRSRPFFLAIVTLLLCLFAPPTLALLPHTPHPTPHTPSLLAQSPSLLDQGTQQYEAGQFEQALTTWKQAEAEYQRAGDRLNVIRSRINQAQAQKALGLYRSAITILEDLNNQVPAEPPSLEKAQILRSLGEAYQVVGNLESAEKSAEAMLQASLKMAESLKSDPDIAAAYFSLGLLNRAYLARIPAQELQIRTSQDVFDRLGTVLQFQQSVKDASGSFQQAVRLSSTPIMVVQAELNDIRLLTDTLPRFNNILQDAVKNLDKELLTNLSTPLLQALFQDRSLQQQLKPGAATDPVARQQYEQAIAQLQQLKTQTIELTDALLTLLNQVPTQLDGLPPSRAAINSRINFAQSLTRLPVVATSTREVTQQLQIQREALRQLQAQLAARAARDSVSPIKPAPQPQSAKPANSAFLPITTQQQLQIAVTASYQDATAVLQRATVDAQTLKNERAQAQALGVLVDIYADQATTPQEWAVVEKLALRTLRLLPAGSSPEIAFRVQRQFARALKQQNKDGAARAAYRVAAKSLQAVRSDLVAIDQDLQYNFRDTVEPIYREAMDALLPDQGQSVEQRDLDEARKLVESLQLAEIDNFLREACVAGKDVALDQIVDRDNPKTAVIYPIVLSNQQANVQKLKVIAKIPGQKDLRYYAVELPGVNAVDQALNKFRQAAEERGNSAKAPAEVIYRWLIAPFEADLQASQTDTVVFVPDGNFRNVPLAALYDHNRYLVERFAIAISPGLQIFDPTPLAQAQLKVLLAGKSEFESAQLPANIRGGPFSPLPYVKTELDRIQAKITSQVLRETDFTQPALEQRLLNAPFNVVHLATHGVFSARKDETFILADDGPINLDQLSTMLRSRDRIGESSLELLVLSACETAKGNNRVTLGLAGMALRAGARSTVGSLWIIYDESTSDLMVQFYSELATAKTTGITKAKALQTAQLKLLQNSDNRYADPYYWAPFILVGNWL